MTRLFDIDPKEKRKDFEAIYEKYKDEPRGLSALTTHELSLLAIMGQHCNLEEHIRYGRCNHPLCCRHTEWDKVSYVFISFHFFLLVVLCRWS